MHRNKRHPQHFQAVAMLLLANVFWGLSFPTIKALSLIHAAVVPGSTSEFITAMLVAPRYVVAALVMFFWQAPKLAKLTKPEMKQGLLLGLFMALGVLLQNDGLQFTSASTSAFLTQLYAILIPLWVALRRRTNPEMRVWMAGALVLAGVAILGHFDWRTLAFGRGEWETLLGSLFFAGQILSLERGEFSQNDAARVTLVMFVVEALVFSCLAAWVTPSFSAVTLLFKSTAWVLLTCVLTGVCSLGAINIMNHWQPKITAVEAGLIYCFEPIFGSLFALFTPWIYSRLSGIDYHNETATLSLLVGGGLITLANLLLSPWLEKRPAAPEARKFEGS